MKNWNISPEDSAAMDKTEYADVQINVVGTSSSQTVAKASQTGIFASLVTNLPEQLMFLLKITLTGFMLIFLMGLLFAFIPDSLFEKSKKE